MSHEVTQRADGTVEAAYSLKPAWHGLGTVIDHLQTSEEIMLNAQLDWKVEQHPAYFSYVDDDHVTHRIQIPGQLANVREDNKVFLGMVSKRYKVVDNIEAFEFMDELYQDGIMKYESAGSLRGGKMVWVLAKMPQAFEVVAGDKLEQYILFRTAHDGTSAIRVMPTSVRVVCQNTLSLALANESKGLSIRHKGNIKTKLDEARKAITTVQSKFDDFHTRTREMTKVSVNMDQMRAFVNILIPKESGKNDTRREKQRASIMSAFQNTRQSMFGTRNTAWAAFNAVTEHVDHNSNYKVGKDSTLSERRFESGMLGTNNTFKQSAFNLLGKMAAAV